MVREHVAAGDWWSAPCSARQPGRLGYAWRLPRGSGAGDAPPGLALRWWLDRSTAETTRRACSTATAPWRRAPDRADAVTHGATSAASRPRRPARCTPVRSSPPSPPGSMRARTADAGWCASRTSTRRATSPARPTTILAQLGRCGLRSRRAATRQSERTALYEAASSGSRARPGLSVRLHAVATSSCRAAPATRRAHGERVYPGTCRDGLHGKAPRVAPAARARVGRPRRRSSPGPTGASARNAQDVAAQVGDFVLRRADGIWAYQLAVVVDDAAQGVTHVVRGEDLADNTPRQIHLQRLLGLPTPRYLHTPLVLAADGRSSRSRTAPRPSTSRRRSTPARRGRGARPRGARHHARRLARASVAAWPASWR